MAPQNVQQRIRFGLLPRKLSLVLDDSGTLLEELADVGVEAFDQFRYDWVHADLSGLSKRKRATTTALKPSEVARVGNNEGKERTQPKRLRLLQVTAVLHLE